MAHKSFGFPPLNLLFNLLHKIENFLGKKEERDLILHDSANRVRISLVKPKVI